MTISFWILHYWVLQSLEILKSKWSCNAATIRWLGKACSVIFFQIRIYTTSFKILFAFAFPSQCQLCGLSKRKHTVAFFKGRGRVRDTLYCIYKVCCPILAPLHNRTLKVNYSFSYLYYQTLLQFIITRYTILLCGVKSSAKFVVIREQWTISRPILKKKMIEFFLYIFTYFYICIFSHKKVSSSWETIRIS